MKNSGSEPSPKPPREKVPFSERMKRFFARENVRDFIAVFAGVFIITLVADLQVRPIDTHPDGADCYYYYLNSQKFAKVWQQPFYYIPGLIFDKLSTDELLGIGFNHYADIDSFFRAPFYNTYLSLWMTAFGGSQLSLLLSQIFLLSVMFGLMFLVMKLFVGRLLAFVGAALGLTYLYFYLDSLNVLTEIFQTIFLLILFYYSHRMLATEKRSLKHYAWLAVLMWLYSLTKLPLKYLIFIMIPLFLYFDQRALNPPRKLIRGETILLVGLFLALNFCSSTVLSRGTPDPKPVTTIGWRNYHAGSIVESEGFNSSTGGHKKEFRDNIDKVRIKAGNGFLNDWFNNYSVICKYAVLDIVKHDPLSYASMTLKKMWANIGYGPFQYGEILKRWRQPMNAFHDVLLFLTILFFFLVLSPEFGWYKAFLLLNAGYLSFIYGLSNPDPRYLFNVAPFYFISVLVLAREFFARKVFLKPVFYAAGGLSLLFFILVRKDFLGLFFTDADAIAALRFLLATGFIAGLVVLLKLVPRFRDVKNSFAEIALLVFVYMVLTACFLDDRRFNHFATTAKVLERRIIVPSSWTNSKQQAFVVVDLSSSRTNGRSVVVRFNGTLLTNMPASVTALDIGWEVTPPDYGYYEPHWAAVRLDPRLIRATNVITLVNNGNEIFYRKKSVRKLMASFFNQLGAQWIFGHYSRRERRIYLKQEIGSLEQRSYADGKPLKGDLNVLLVVRQKGDYWVDRRYDTLNTYNTKLIALFNPLDNKIVFWSEKDPGKEFEKVYGNLAGYLAGEYDRYRAPFLLY